jgi:hypothetical protein
MTDTKPAVGDIATSDSAIKRLADAHGGPHALARLINERNPAIKPIHPQEACKWLKRGFAASRWLYWLRPCLVDGITLDDLMFDRVRAEEDACASRVSEAA